MAESSATQNAALLYQKCISLFNGIRDLIKIHAPRSLSRTKEIDLRHVGEKLEAWYLDIFPIRQAEELDAIFERYIGKVQCLLNNIHDLLKLIYDLLSSPQGSTEDERTHKLKASIVSVEKLYGELADDDDIDALKTSLESRQNNFPGQFDRPTSSRSQEGRVPRTLMETGRAATDPQSQLRLNMERGSDFQLSHRNTFGTTPEELRRRSSTPASQFLKGPVPTSNNPGVAPGFSGLSQEFTQPPCEAARDKLTKIKISTSYSNRGNGPATIFPVEEVKRILLEDNTVEKTFHCDCPRCYNHSKLLSESRHFDKESLTGKFATTFALLIYVYRSGLICHFQKKGKCLTDGPLERDNLKFISSLQVPTPSSSHIAIDEIIGHQYMFHLKQFEVWHHSEELRSEEALPITEIQEEGSGAYGTVYSFTFLPGYAGRGYEVFEPQKFARKVFVKTKIASGIDEFNNLLRIYRKGTSQRAERWTRWRSHIMEALAGYEHGDIYFIIFPFAESTLAKYLRGEAGHTRLTPRYLWRQMEGVAGGLAFLHESYLSTTGNDIVSPSIAFHFDLKPENILIRNGVVMISDFGQSKFAKASLEDSSSGVDSDRVFFNYGPPEHNLSTYDKGAREKSNYNFDIWSLGGIFSELVTFHIKQPAGRQGFLDYRNARRQDDRDAGSRGIVTTFFLDQYTVKPSVMEQHENLRAEIEARSNKTYEGTRDAWLENFAGNEFFALLTSMLSILTETIQRPKAVKVQEILGVLCQKAELTADHKPPRNLSLQGRLDIWQQFRNGLLWDELPKSSRHILCYYLTQGAPKPTRCVILMQRLVNRQMQMLLLWHHERSQYTQKQQTIPISHTSGARQTGVIIDYFGHPLTDVTPIDLAAETSEDTDEYHLDEKLVSACYKIVPVTNTLTNCAALLFVNAEDAFSFQAALIGQYVVSNFSVTVQGAEIALASSKFSLKKKPSPEVINQEALLQIWSDVDLNPLVQRKSSIISTQASVAESYLSFDRVPVIHVAVITRRFLYLFKAEHSKINVSEGRRISTQDSIVLKSNSTVFFDKIDLQPRDGAIMVNIPEPDKYIKCEEATLRVTYSQDVASFWNTLDSCQKLCAKIEMQRRNSQVRSNR